MKPWLNMRRVLSVGLVWGFLWATVTMVIGTIIGIIDPGKGLPEMLVTAPLGALSALASIILLRTRTVGPAAH